MLEGTKYNIRFQQNLFFHWKLLNESDSLSRMSTNQTRYKTKNPVLTFTCLMISNSEL